MKVGIMADSHDNLPKIRSAMEVFRAEGVGLILHAGDFVAPFAVRAMTPAPARVVAVFGNNDGERIGLAKAFEAMGEVHPRIAIVQVEGKRIGVVHQDELVAPLSASNAIDVLVYGHTHHLDIRREGNVLVVNPGEVGGWLTGRSTVVVLDTQSLETKVVEL
ncbi:MAG: YfcE family phosphodiesterase [Armatimonadota bacterium]